MAVINAALEEGNVSRSEIRSGLLQSGISRPWPQFCWLSAHPQGHTGSFDRHAKYVNAPIGGHGCGVRQWLTG